MIAEILAVAAFLFENCTGVLISRTSIFREDEEQSLIQQDVRQYDDFLSFDPNDDVFREFDHPEGEEEDPKSWRKVRPAFKSSLWTSFKTVFATQILAGTGIGLLAIFITFLDFNFADLCYEKTSEWNTMPLKIQRIRVTAQSVEGFTIELWYFLVLTTAFPGSLLKKLNLLVLNLLAAFTDMSYRLYLQLYGIYKLPWMSFPLNVLFTTMVLLNAWILGRHFSSLSIKGAVKYAFILSAQFTLGMFITYLLVYKLLPWYNVQSESMKVFIAGACPIVTAIPKVVSRLGAQKLNRVVHPGTANVFVGALYGASAIVFRIMQAELSSIDLFIALGIGHAFIDMLERLTITMRDYLWERFCRLFCRQRRPLSKYSTPRSRRFMADVSIQILIQESTSLIAALGFIHLFHFMYSNNKPPFTDNSVLINFAIRCIIGLCIDVVFNTISVVIQTRLMNIAVNRVWRKKWRYHLVVNLIITSLTIIYFTEYLLDVARKKYDLNHPEEIRFFWNCSEPLL
ncbi:uncharacterized protein LOC116610153 [Nematostella vectensis]|uniref:uncharacterized protein LOC116610153 n=1 Tax=Nematostella vectensis TaxID=45351 RepID=UPI00138FDC47|nr:uncharacterized protein LOC116610153 [Nematostella vectensis]